MGLVIKKIYFYRLALLISRVIPWAVALSACDFVNLNLTAPLLSSPAPQPSPSSTATAVSLSAPLITSIVPTSGSVAGGTLVTLIGKGFTSGNTSIWIGNQPCLNPTFKSSTTMTCQTSPNTSGAKTIVLSTSSGQIAQFPSSTLPVSFAKGFTYISPPPVLTGATGHCPPTYPVGNSTICPAFGSLRSSTLVTITGTGFQTGAIATVGGQLCCGVQVAVGQPCSTPTATVNLNVTPNTLTCYAPPNPLKGIAQISVINPDNQFVISVDNPFQYNDPVNLSYSPNPALVSLNQPISLTHSISGLTPLTYSVLPSLPTGLTLNSSTGDITGTPTALLSPTSYAITATNSSGSTSTSLVLGVFDFGTGEDGSLTVNSPGNVVINSYAAISSLGGHGHQIEALLDYTSTFTPGGKILVIQMQDNPFGSSSPTLLWEFATIRPSWTPPHPLPSPTPSPYPITLVNPLTEIYSSGIFNSSPYSVAAQIVSVPQFTDVDIKSGASITAPPWNGITGGIVAFQATGTTQVNGVINAKGIGYRGGPGSTTSQAFQGESWNYFPSAALTPPPTSTHENYGGGGGGSIGSAEIASGGGGGYGTSGLAGATPILPPSINAGIPGSGGTGFGIPDYLFSFSNLLLGPGGGGAASGTSCITPEILDGSSGGGIIFVQSLNIALGLNGLITAQGKDSQVGCNGISGAGAGGSIYLRSAIMALPHADPLLARGVIAAGGSGGTTGGSTGGAGMIRLDYRSISSVPTTSPAISPTTLPTPSYTESP